MQTSSPDRDSAFIDVGLDVQVAKELTLFTDYQTEAGQSNFFAQSIQAGIKVGFLISAGLIPRSLLRLFAVARDLRARVQL